MTSETQPRGALVCWIITALCLFAFVVIEDQGQSQAAKELFGLHMAPGGDLRFWSLISYQFMHEDWRHLLMNLLVLAIVGPPLEQALGGSKFILFFLVAGACSGLAQGLGAGYSILLIGASGSIAGLIGALFVSNPSQRIALPPPPWPTPILTSPLWLIGGVWILGQIFNNESHSLDGIAYTTHLAGVVFGMVAAAPLGLLKTR